MLGLAFTRISQIVNDYLKTPQKDLKCDLAILARHRVAFRYKGSLVNEQKKR